MNLKDYEMKPDDGLFEKIQHRLAVRRTLRIGGAALAAVVAVGVAAIALWPKTSVDEVAMVVAQPTESVVSCQPSVASRKWPVGNGQKTDDVDVAKSTSQAVNQSGSQVITNQSADDLSDLVQMLPQGLPAIAQLDEAAAEEYANQMHCAPVYIGPADAEDTTSPAIVIQSTKEQKATEPMPHYDNVIWAPNVIIPDGEIDDNRNFVIKATSQITDFKLHIYNRNGRRIYLTSDPQFAWNGTMNGVRVPQGAYVWVATFRDSDGVMRQEKGTVTVLR